MSGYGLTYRLTIRNPIIYALNFVAIFIFIDLFEQ